MCKIERVNKIKFFIDLLYSPDTFTSRFELTTPVFPTTIHNYPQIQSIEPMTIIKE